MHLYLNHSIHTKPVAAAFIRGHDPFTWLKEIDRWKQSIDELECYIIPQSIQSPEAAGLFVIFKQPSAFASIELADAYCSIADKLFIPVNAEVLPQVSNDEWRSLLIWHRQVLHPVIGLVGFDIDDQIDPGKLLLPSQSINIDWSFANPGLDEKPLLNSIEVVTPDPAEMVDSMKKELGNKPFESILEDKDGKKRTVIDKLADRLKLFGLKPLLWLTRGILKIKPATEGGKDGALSRAEKWLSKNVDDLEKRREDEIKRLSRLFDEDSDEALRYAIPLDSPYLKRGQSDENDNSYKLGERRPWFNLGGLGGGLASGYWSLEDNQYNDLRTKYHRAAQKAIEEKDYRKAAYVYAHLLSDFAAAANVLQQGGYYREAAALYREHLKNENAAAECLEKGGLYLEAIDLYKNLNKNEKVGDIYTRLQRNDDAGFYYEKHIDASMDRSDYLDAARVINEKLKQQDRAKETLLTGWKQSANGESCLKAHIDISLKQEEGRAAKELQQVYNHHTTPYQRSPLLNIMEYLKKHDKTDETNALMQELAYHLIHDETKDGNLLSLGRLKQFVEGDKLIASDASRYVASKKANGKSIKTPSVIRLDENTKWIKAIWHRNQFLILGLRNDMLQLARGNWYGNIEYHSWAGTQDPYARFTFIHAPNFSNSIIIHSPKGIPVSHKKLERNKYFSDTLRVHCPAWMNDEFSQYVMNNENSFTKLNIENGMMTLHHYDMEGRLTGSKACMDEHETQKEWKVHSNPQLVRHHDYEFYYTYQVNMLLAINAHTGKFVGFSSPSGIRFFAASGFHTPFFLILSTNGGCILFEPGGLALNKKGGYFANEFIPYHIVFIASDRFVMAGKKTAQLYEIRNGVPEMLNEVHAENPIVGILATNHRNSFALVDEKGVITKYEID